ncbi:hypothetical protein L1987_61262 [Smallanthus sonchifolius]|uniref:Uncharacterized protein n=1 Tax=Smallanthus sonchifolius TaxID=185202 RepID=A0ACB9DAJ9_9ASTR|nr:hypothetical protein L1987_61262 [Smallanthus sonchifolius]
MPKHDYAILRDEDKAWIKLRTPISIFFLTFVSLSIFISTAIRFKIVFRSDSVTRPFCTDPPIEKDAEIAAFYWMIVFVPSAIFSLLSAIYLVAGINVAYTGSTKHGCLKVVKNSCCAPNRGGVQCLFILNFMFAIIFSLLAIFLGPHLPLLDSSCSIPLFWCYEIQSWGLVILNGVTASLLRKKAAMGLDDGELSGQIIGLEMLEVNPVEFTPDVERQINEGFRSWMGTSYLSSDDEEGY